MACSNQWRLPASPVPMWVFEHRTGAIIAANDTALLEYGYTREELLERNVRDICVAQGPGGRLLSDFRVEDTAWVGRSVQRRKDGSTFEAELSMLEAGEALQSATMVIVDPLPRLERDGPTMARAAGPFAVARTGGRTR